MYSFLYKPVLLLKSGIPDSVETPAPPKNTILLLSLIIFITFSNSSHTCYHYKRSAKKMHPFRVHFNLLITQRR